MSTVNQALAEAIIAADGYYLDDPRVTKVVKYTNSYGGESYAILYAHHDQLKYEQSPFCGNVTTLWEAPR